MCAQVVLAHYRIESARSITNITRFLFHGGSTNWVNLAENPMQGLSTSGSARPQ